MAGGRAHTSGAVTVSGTSRAGMRSQIVSSPVTQKGPGWAAPLNSRRQPRQISADIATVGLALASLADDFNDNAVDAGLWPNSFGTYSETGGRARISCDTGYNAYSSALTYTLAESSIYLRAYPPAAGGATTEAWTQVLVKQQTSGTDLGFEISPLSGNLTMFSRTGFFDAGAVAITYSATDHAWLRIREKGGTVYWETSPDASTWTAQRSTASPTWVTDPNLEFQLIAHRSDGTVDFVEYDSLNVQPSGQSGDASLAVAAGLSASGSAGASGSAALAATAGLTAAATRATFGDTALAVTAGLSGDGVRAAFSGGTLAATAGRAAAGSLGAVGGGTVAGSATLSSAGMVQAVGAAFAAGVASLSAVGRVDLAGAASRSVTAGFAADGTVTAGSSGSASLAISAGLSTAGIASLVGSTVSGLTVSLAADGTVHFGLTGGAALAGAVALSAAGMADTLGSGGLAAGVLVQAAGQVAAAVVRGSAQAGAGAAAAASGGEPATARAAGRDGRVAVATGGGS